MPKRFLLASLAFALTLPVLGAGAASAQTRLLRFPDIQGERVVFTYAGDLWLAPAAGGSATRLTAHPGLELFAKFSPDGQWIAFTGQYDGDEQVYVVPAGGGVPKQLTWYPARGPLAPRWGYDNQVLGWSRDGGSVLFRSMRDGWDMADTRLYLVPVDGGLGEPLPMPVSGAGDFSPDGKRVAYNPIARDFRTWKRYQGGWSQDLYIYDLASHESRNITSHVRTDRDPMWIGDRIYFNSDRTGTLNLHAYDVASGAVTQVTRSDRWDVRWPSSDHESRIVYESNGELNVLDVRSGDSRRIPIEVPDDGLHTRVSQISAEGTIEDAALSPKGERALFVARGDIFTTPIEKGVARNLTRSSTAHDKAARWSPDGRKIAFLSDRTGEEEVWLVNQDGSGKPEQLTTGGRALRYAPEWAPDGKRLAFGDKDGRLWVVTVADRKLVEVADSPQGFIRDYNWSPCGGHLSFSMPDANGLRSVWVWSVEDGAGGGSGGGSGSGQPRRVTSEHFHEYGATWDPEGKYLYYLAAREYAPQFDSFEYNYAFDRNMGIFAVALRRDVPNLFPVESDEVTIEGEGDKDQKDRDPKDGKAAEEKARAARPKGYTKIDWEGLGGRVMRVPVPADNYDGLAAARDGNLLYVRVPAQFLGRDSAKPASLHVYSVKERRETTLSEDTNGYTVSADGSKILILEQGQHKLADASAAGKDGKKTVSTAGLVVTRNPREEWVQIFDESWRRYRDFFYVENMHGYDWDALREQYRPLVRHVGHRSDLNYVIGEMIAELNVSHAYVAGGDYELPKRPRVALPGARFELDGKAQRYRIAKIFRGHNEEALYRSPLTEVGVDVKVGDYVLAIDGEELRGNDNPYRLLRHKADRPVRLTVSSRPSLEGAREVTFRPLSSENDLVYLEMVTRNRERVDKLSGGKVGYLHIPDMGEGGMREFIKHYYGQVRNKEGLIVDVRDNGGGFISQTLIERLRREVLSVDFGRLSEEPQTYPAVAFHGHMACLINEGSSSDGDIFPAMFKQAGLGPVIGKRSWGGVVGISGHGPLIDGGQIMVPEAGTVSLEGEWIIEGYGVDPDIVVENDPKSVLAGRDPQLERGVEEVMKKIREQPKRLPKKPAGPDKTQAGIAVSAKP